MGPIPGYGYDYPGVCDHGHCAQWATHVHDDHRYCRRHYQIVVQNFTECMGCRSTGKWYDNGQPHPSGRACPLCKGEGVLAP